MTMVRLAMVAASLGILLGCSGERSAGSEDQEVPPPAAHTDAGGQPSVSTQEPALTEAETAPEELPAAGEGTGASGGEAGTGAAEGSPAEADMAESSPDGDAPPAPVGSAENGADEGPPSNSEAQAALTHSIETNMNQPGAVRGYEEFYASDCRKAEEPNAYACDLSGVLEMALAGGVQHYPFKNTTVFRKDNGEWVVVSPASS